MTFTADTEEFQRRPSVDLSGIHVLVVEDTDDARDALRIIFQFYGAKVRTAASAEEGKRLLSEDRPDIMVSDIAMPDDGIELIRAVKASADAQDLRVPVIAITAHRFVEMSYLQRASPSSSRSHLTRSPYADWSYGTRRLRMPEPGRMKAASNTD